MTGGTTTRKITYRGNPSTATALVSMLHAQRVRVEVEQPTEYRNDLSALEAVALSMIANGAYEAIKAGVAEFKRRFPRERVEIEGEEPDDEPE